MPALITPGPACVPCSGILTSPEISGLLKSSVAVLLKALNTLTGTPVHDWNPNWRRVRNLA